MVNLQKSTLVKKIYVTYWVSWSRQVGSGDYGKRKTEAITAIAIHANTPLHYLSFDCKRWLRKVYLNFIWYIHHGITVELTRLLK